jgi:hypothetical protein
VTTAEERREWEIIGAATTAIGFQLESDPASQAVSDYIWRMCDPEGRRLSPMPDFVRTQQPDHAELERLMVGVANASRAWPEDKAAVVRMIRRAFESERDRMG